MTNVIHASGGQIVEQNDAIAAVEQPLREMRTDETSAASNQKAQNPPLEFLDVVLIVTIVTTR
jgi:hypothetical protein